MLSTSSNDSTCSRLVGTAAAPEQAERRRGGEHRRHQAREHRSKAPITEIEDEHDEREADPDRLQRLDAEGRVHLVEEPHLIEQADAVKIGERRGQRGRVLEIAHERQDADLVAELHDEGSHDRVERRRTQIGETKRRHLGGACSAATARRNGSNASGLNPRERARRACARASSGTAARPPGCASADSADQRNACSDTTPPELPGCAARSRRAATSSLSRSASCSSRALAITSRPSSTRETSRARGRSPPAAPGRRR